MKKRNDHTEPTQSNAPPKVVGFF